MITRDKREREITTGNSLLHGGGKGSQIYLTKFAVNRVRTGMGDEGRKAKESNGIYQQCDITGENDIPHIKVRC